MSSVGRIERSVLEELKKLEPVAVARGRRVVRSVLAELALEVARQLDAGPPVTHVAKLATELRVLREKLVEVARGRGDGQRPGELSTPEWTAEPASGGAVAADRDTAQSGAADVGAAGGGGGQAAG